MNVDCFSGYKSSEIQKSKNVFSLSMHCFLLFIPLVSSKAEKNGRNSNFLILLSLAVVLPRGQRVFLFPVFGSDAIT
jgi:hypothetical protein